MLRSAVMLDRGTATCCSWPSLRPFTAACAGASRHRACGRCLMLMRQAPGQAGRKAASRPAFARPRVCQGPRTSKPPDRPAPRAAATAQEDKPRPAQRNEQVFREIAVDPAADQEPGRGGDGIAPDFRRERPRRSSDRGERYRQLSLSRPSQVLRWLMSGRIGLSGVRFEPLRRTARPPPTGFARARDSRKARASTPMPPKRCSPKVLIPGRKRASRATAGPIPILSPVRYANSDAAS